MNILFDSREWKEKFDVVDDEEEDTMTYHGRTLFIPRPDKNGPGLTGNEIIVMPHPSKFDFTILSICRISNLGG